MSEEKSQTQPLSELAILAFEPTPKQLMAEMRRQNTVLNQITRHQENKAVVLDKILEQAVKTNGRVTNAEDGIQDLREDTRPVVNFFKNIRILAVASVTLLPFLFKIMEIAIDHIWPSR